MNMGDDIAGAVVQVSTTAVEEAAHVTTSVIEAIFKFLHYMAELDREKRRQKTDVTNKEITELKGGKVQIKDLMSHCRETGEQLVTSEIGMTKDDMQYINSKAKSYGIPIAFRNEKGKDNIYASIRKSDLPLYKKCLLELDKEKLATRPQELSNFKCKEWEIPFINAELKQHDLSAQFAQTKDGEFFAMYESRDAKAIEIARSEFVRKAQEVESNIEFDKDEKGFFIIRDKISGRTHTFDENPDKKSISRELEKQFGYDKNKANIAAQKFGKEMLTGEEKTKYFSDDVKSNFSYVSKVSWKDENILAKAYDCYYVTPKEDGVSRIVFQKDDGSFAILNPPRQTKAIMRDILKKQLGITDIKELNALIAKAEHVSKVNAQYRKVFGNNEDLHVHDASFTKEAFDMSDPAVVSGMLRTDEAGNTFAKAQPIDSISTEIERKGIDHFKIRSTALSTETDQNGQQHSVPQMQQLVLSFSNKKAAIEELKEMYISQGVPESAAKDMAKSVYRKAELQNAEPVIAIEQTKDANIALISGNKRVVVSASDRDKAIETISKEYGIPESDAVTIMEKADEIVVTSSNEHIANYGVVKEMTREQFIAAGLIKNDNNGTVNNSYLVSSYTQNENNGDQSWDNDEYLLSKDNHYYLFHDSGYDSKVDKFYEVSAEKATEFVSEHGILSNNVESTVAISNNDISFDTAMQNGHEFHPEGNILSNGVDKLGDKLDDVVDEIEEATSRGGR